MKNKIVKVKKVNQVKKVKKEPKYINNLKKVSKRKKSGKSGKDVIKKAMVYKKKVVVVEVVEEGKQSKNLQVSKFLGYCYNCNSLISSTDKVSEEKFRCLNCDKDMVIKKLLEKVEIDKEPLTTNDFMRDTEIVPVIDMKEKNEIIDDNGE